MHKPFILCVRLYYKPSDGAKKATDSGVDTWGALAKAGRSALDHARAGRIDAGSAQIKRAGASIPKRRDPLQDQGTSADRWRFGDPVSSRNCNGKASIYL